MLPWLLRPDEFAFLKPIPSREVASRYGFQLDYDSIPSAAAYEQWNEFCRGLLEALLPYGAIDLLDVHSFLWRIHSPVVDHPWHVRFIAAMRTSYFRLTLAGDRHSCLTILKQVGIRAEHLGGSHALVNQVAKCQVCFVAYCPPRHHLSDCEDGS